MIDKDFIRLLDKKWVWLVKESDGEVSLHTTEPRRTTKSDDPWGEYSSEWVSEDTWTYLEGFRALFRDLNPGKYNINTKKDSK